MYKYSAFGRIIKYIGLLRQLCSRPGYFTCGTSWNNLFYFYKKNKQISAPESSFQMLGRPILSYSRILFVYTDKSPELCPVEI